MTWALAVSAAVSERVQLLVVVVPILYKGAQREAARDAACWPRHAIADSGAAAVLLVIVLLEVVLLICTAQQCISTTMLGLQTQSQAQDRC